MRVFAVLGTTAVFAHPGGHLAAGAHCSRRGPIRRALNLSIPGYQLRFNALGGTGVELEADLLDVAVSDYFWTDEHHFNLLASVAKRRKGIALSLQQVTVSEFFC
jgi:hypothetical protein